VQVLWGGRADAVAQGAVHMKCGIIIIRPAMTHDSDNHLDSAGVLFWPAEGDEALGYA
jgi:hypothetical protein